MAIIDNIIKEGSRVIIKSPKLNIDELSTYDLNLFISSHEFGFSVIDPVEKQCLRLEYLAFKEAFVPGKNNQMILEIFQDNHLLPAAFWKNINVFVSNKCYTFVPNELFSEDSIGSYLEFNTEYNATDYDCWYYSKDTFKIIFGYDKKIKELLNKIYPNRNVNFVSNIVNLVKDQSLEKNIVHLSQDNSQITIVAYKNHRFEYCNTFNYNNTDDALYFILLVYRELNFSTEEIETVISGSIDTQTILQARLFKYIRNVNLGSRPKDIKLCYNFDEIEDNRFFNLLNSFTND